MFDIAFSELMLIGVIALIIIPFEALKDEERRHGNRTSAIVYLCCSDGHRSRIKIGNCQGFLDLQAAQPAMIEQPVGEVAPLLDLRNHQPCADRVNRPRRHKYEVVLPNLPPQDAQVNQHPADQPWPRRRRNGIDIGERNARLVRRAGDDPVEMRDVGAGGEFGHHAPIGGMLLELRTHDIGKDRAAARRVPFDDRRGRLVAARLDTQNPHAACPALRNGLSRPATRSGLQ